MIPTCERCETPNSFCAQFDDDLRSKLCDLATSVKFTKYKKLYFVTYNPRIFIIKKGFAAEAVLLPDGKKLGLRFHGPGDFCGDVYNDYEIFPHKTSYCEVLQPIEGCLISTENIRQLCDENAKITQAFLSGFEQSFNDFLLQTLCMQTYSSEKKVSFLLDIIKENGMAPNDLTHEDIAWILNLNRVTVTKAMKTLTQGTA